MRWLLGFIAAAIVLLTVGWILRARHARELLRIGVLVVEDEPESAALLEGAARALEDRDGRAGRWRVELVPHHLYAEGATSRRPFDARIPGLQESRMWTAPDGTPLVPSAPAEEAALILQWAKRRGLRNLCVPGFDSEEHRAIEHSISVLGAVPLGQPMFPVASALRGGAAAQGLVLERRPWDCVHSCLPLGPGPSPELQNLDLLVVENMPCRLPQHGRLASVSGLRAGGFRGPVFIAAHVLDQILDVNPASADECFVVLSPLKPSPPAFQGSHPYVYAGYRAAVRFFDLLDADSKTDPRTVTAPSVFEELREPARLYRIRKGALVPE